MSGGLFDWVGEVVAEIGSEIAEAFGFDDSAGSNSGATQARTPSENQERGRASYLQGKDLERYTEQQLDEFGLNALWDESNLVYDETLEEYGKNTQVDVIIRDGNDNEVAIIECKAYTSKWNNADAVDQARRLVYLANERGVTLIFSTSDGTADCFGSRVKEVLNETQWFVISPDNIFFADPSDVKENGVTLGLPPELESHWKSNSSDGGGESFSSNGREESLLGGLISSFVGSNSGSPSSSNSEDSGGSWDLFGNWFGDSSDSKSSNSSDSNSSNFGDNGGSWFSGLFGDSSDSESSDSSDSNSSDSGSGYSSDSDSSYSYESGSSYSSNSGSSDSGNSGGSWDLFGDSSDSESSDSSDSNSSDSNSSYSSDSDSSYSSDSDSSYSSDSDSSYSSDSDSSYSSDSGSSYSSDSGSSDYGSGDDGDSGGSDSSSSSSDSYW
jgi:hypothetical protein